MEKLKKQFGGRQEGAGRKPLPLELQKVRLEPYVKPVVAEWIKQSGGNKYAASLLAIAYDESLISNLQPTAQRP